MPTPFHVYRRLDPVSRRFAPRLGWRRSRVWREGTRALSHEVAANRANAPDREGAADGVRFRRSSQQEEQGHLRGPARMSCRSPGSRCGGPRLGVDREADPDGATAWLASAAGPACCDRHRGVAPTARSRPRPSDGHRLTHGAVRLDERGSTPSSAVLSSFDSTPLPPRERPSCRGSR